MSSKSINWLATEWRTSIAVLSDLLGEPVSTGSVPSGYYSRRVAEVGASAGLKLLFTLEPSTSAEVVGGCVVAGRYTIRRQHSARYVASIASGALLPRVRQQVAWNAKKVLKAFPYYTELRRLYFDTRSRVIQQVE